MVDSLDKLNGNAPKADDDDNLATTRFIAKRKTNYSTRDYAELLWTNGYLQPATVGVPSGVIEGIRRRQDEEKTLAAFRILAACRTCDPILWMESPATVHFSASLQI